MDRWDGSELEFENRYLDLVDALAELLDEYARYFTFEEVGDALVAAFWKYLEGLGEPRGWSREDAAILVGVTRETVSRWRTQSQRVEQGEFGEHTTAGSTLVRALVQQLARRKDTGMELDELEAHLRDKPLRDQTGRRGQSLFSVERLARALDVLRSLDLASKQGNRWSLNGLDESPDVPDRCLGAILVALQAGAEDGLTDEELLSAYLGALGRRRYYRDAVRVAIDKGLVEQQEDRIRLRGHVASRYIHLGPGAPLGNSAARSVTDTFDAIARNVSRYAGGRGTARMLRVRISLPSGDDSVRAALSALQAKFIRGCEEAEALSENAPSGQATLVLAMAEGAL